MHLHPLFFSPPNVSWMIRSPFPDFPGLAGLLFLQLWREAFSVPSFFAETLCLGKGSFLVLHCRDESFLPSRSPAACLNPIIKHIFQRPCRCPQTGGCSFLKCSGLIQACSPYSQPTSHLILVLSVAELSFSPSVDKETETLYKVTKREVFQIPPSWFTTSS